MPIYQPRRRNYAAPPISPIPAAVQAQALGRAPGQVNTAGIDAGTPPFQAPAGTAGQQSVESHMPQWTEAYRRYYQGHGGYQGYIGRQAERFGTSGLHLAGPQRGGTQGVGDDVLMDILARKEILQKALRQRNRPMTGRY